MNAVESTKSILNEINAFVIKHDGFFRIVSTVKILLKYAITSYYERRTLQDCIILLATVIEAHFHVVVTII